MAETAAAPPLEAPAAAGGKKLGMIAALTFGGALLGGLVAAFLVAPKILAHRMPAAAHGDSLAAPAQGDSTAHTSEGKGGEGGESKFVQLSNIIVNPAGSQGTRFLMTSVAIAVANDEAQKVLKEREVELRDRITSILETETMAQLTAPGARDSLKVKIAGVISAVAGPKVAFRVFVPQFVIQ
ncbi:MAG TPA: flagellar basal body-associated FliL family protein [Gemmatimonadales bacterium]|jgi:flagellar FliL protein|nr:flagellar basal body-associated FliL family protein [Gemmatimonadales bacterium]